MWWRNFPDPFLKKKIEHHFGSIVKSFIHVAFIVCQVEGYLKKSKLSCRPLALTSNKAFLKNKRRSGTSLPASSSP